MSVQAFQDGCYSIAGCCLVGILAYGLFVRQFAVMGVSFCLGLIILSIGTTFRVEKLEDRKEV